MRVFWKKDIVIVVGGVGEGGSAEVEVQWWNGRRGRRSRDWNIEGKKQRMNMGRKRRVAFREVRLGMYLYQWIT